MADDLAKAARDLAVLSGADRRAILAALKPEERLRIEAAMRGAPTPAASASEPLHSPWFEGLQESSEVTAAARAALASASHPAPAIDARSTGRSLMQAAGGLLSTAGLRR
jgi:hypothetical protein